MINESGLLQVGGVVVLSGPALRSTLQCVRIAIKHREIDGLPRKTFDALACELLAAMAADGHSDVRTSAVRQPVPMDPTVPLDEAAARLSISLRHARRLAPQLGGRKLRGSWFVDETALNEHIGETQ